MDRLTKKIIKQCGDPQEYCFEYVVGAASYGEGIRRMKEYVAAVRKVEREAKKG